MISLTLPPREKRTGVVPVLGSLLAALAPGCFLSPSPGPDASRPRDLVATILDLAATPPDFAGAPEGADLTTPCSGVRPPKDAFGAQPSPWRFLYDGSGPDGAVYNPYPKPGDPAPRFAIADFHPLSCGFGATYGLDLFKGRPLMVALWSGW